MARIAGITIERTATGKPAYARIDLKKHGDRLMSFFQEVGLDKEVSPYNPEFVAKIRQSEKQIEDGKFHVLDVDNLWK